MPNAAKNLVKPAATGILRAIVFLTIAGATMPFGIAAFYVFRGLDAVNRWANAGVSRNMERWNAWLDSN